MRVGHREELARDSGPVVNLSDEQKIMEDSSTRLTLRRG